MTHDLNQIIIESYGIGETRPLPKKTISLAKIAEGRINVLTRDLSTKINDIPAQNSVMGLAINHIHKDTETETCFGKGFRLSVNEKFVLKTNEENNEIYSYIDENGDEHLFKEYFYYLNSTGDKQYIYYSPESSITISRQG